MKKNLKPYVYKLIEHVKVRYRTFCRTVQRVYVVSEVKIFSIEAEGKPSVNSATKLYVFDPKPSDLSMDRMKRK